MKYKKILLTICIIACILFSISSTAAADVNDVAIASESQDDVLEQVTYNEKISSEKIEANSTEVNKEVISAKQGTFTDLNKIINDAEPNSVITLEKDYSYNTEFSSKGISINKPLTIDGKNHIIDGKSKSRIFKITSDNVILKNIRFVGGIYDDGKGSVIYNSGKNLKISSCNFSKCSVGDNNGVIYNNGDSFNLVSCDFSGCSAETDWSGVVYNAGKNMKMSYCKFSKCSSDGSEAFTSGVVCNRGNYLEISHCTFSNCKYPIYNKGNNLKISQCKFSNSMNIINFGKNCKIVSCSFSKCGKKSPEKNPEFFYGGAIYNGGNNLNIVYCKFSNCYLVGDDPQGGAIYSSNGNLKISHCKFSKCFVKCVDSIGSSAFGGAIYIAGGTSNIVSCNFSNCYATYKSYKHNGAQGGAICFDYGNLLKVSHCKFSNCFAKGGSVAGTYGGAINSGDSLKISSCTFSKCHATIVGGAVSAGGNRYKVSLCCFLNCHAKEGTLEYNHVLKNSIFIKSKAVSKLEVTKKKGSNYVIKLYKSNGKPAKNIKFVLKITNKKQKTLKTNSKGIAKFKAK